MTAAADADDAALLERCRQGERAAWVALVQRYERLVYTVARRAGFDEHEAADVFQAVFEQLWRSIDRLREPDRLRAWIVTIAKRESLRRRALSQRTVPIDGLEDQGHGIADTGLLPDEELEQLQQAHRLQAALARIDERCQRLLQLLFSEEAPPYDEIAAALGMPIGSLGPTRSRCLAKLRTLMERA